MVPLAHIDKIKSHFFEKMAWVSTNIRNQYMLYTGSDLYRAKQVIMLPDDV